MLKIVYHMKNKKKNILTDYRLKLINERADNLLIILNEKK